LKQIALLRAVRLLLGDHGLAVDFCMSLLLLFTVLQPQSAFSQESADEMWRFAEHLFQSKEYYRALGEYERFIFMFPQNPRVNEAELQAARCYRYGGKADKAFDLFLKIFNQKAAEAAGRSALKEMIAVRLDQGLYAEAIYWAQRYLQLYPESPEKEEIRRQLSWLYIEVGNYPQAAATLKEIVGDYDNGAELRALIEALQEGAPPPVKSPRVAGTLATILPGAGHFYVGQPGRGVTSFLLNGLFIGAAVLAFKNDSPVLGSILVFLELGWYQGGIRSASVAARKVNAREQMKFRRHLKENFKVSFGLAPGPLLAVQLAF